MPELHTTAFDTLLAVIAILLPERARRLGRRVINVASERDLTAAELEPALSALSDHRSDRQVDAEVIGALLGAINRLTYSGADVAVMTAQIQAYAERRWAMLAQPLADRVVNTSDRSRILSAFPQLGQDPALMSATIAAIADASNFYVGLDELLADLSPATIGEARLLIDALETRRRTGDRSGKDLTTPVFAAIGRGLRWSAWAVLQTIVRARPDYAEPLAVFERTGDRTRESQTTIDARLEIARAIEPLSDVRAVAAILLQLIGRLDGGWNDGLTSRPAEVRAAYVETLCDAIDDNADLRRAVIEVLLWSGDGRVADLAQFAAVALADAVDRPWLVELETHPAQIVRFAARAIRAARFGDPLRTAALPVTNGLAQSLAAIEVGAAPSDEPARTWLGDRAVEQLIERTVAAVEARFARDYVDHGDEGEDRILSSLFTTLAIRFSDLDQALNALARAASAPNRAAVTMRYRNVDRAEEGKKGVKGARSFSADLCIIIDPILHGNSMGRRVTLVQAKRLYRDHSSTVQPSWNASFAIDLDQRRALQEQTESSVYFFHGPPLGSRGVPVIPTQLVADLSEHEGSGAQLARTTVAIASRSLADWLTYDALALRVGDPFAKLVEKAEGRPGSLPRALLDIPTVEIDVAVTKRSEEG